MWILYIGEKCDPPSTSSLEVFSRSAGRDDDNYSSNLRVEATYRGKFGQGVS